MGYPERGLFTRLGIILLAVALGGPARAGAGSAALGEVLTLARDGDFRGAVRAMPATTTLTVEDVPAIQQAVAVLREQESDAALQLLAAWRRVQPDARAPRVALEQMWPIRPLPPVLDALDIPFFPVDAETLNLPAVGAQPAETVVTIRPKSFLTIPPVKEPRHGEMYSGILGVYASQGGRLRLRFQMHFVDAATAARARQAGRWLGALALLTDRMLGPASQARYPVSVWLSPGGRPDAETWNGSIVIHGVGAGRSGLEWVRQITHEWGHAVLPGGGGFSAPEAWAAGDLGERLFLPAMKAAGCDIAWGEPLDISGYTHRYVDPPRADFARTGPIPRLVDGSGEAAFDHYLGAALYVAGAYGMPLLAAALNDLDGPRTADLLAAVSRTLAARREWTVRRVAGVEGPAAICIPVRGRYMLEAHGPDGNAAIPGAPRTFMPGWTRVDWRGALLMRRMSEPGKG